MAVQPNLQNKYECRNKQCFLKEIVKLSFLVKNEEALL